jgi:hypothetical protein
MVSRRRILPVLLVVLLVLAVSFVAAVTVVDFHAMESATTADASVGTSRANDAVAPTDEPLSLVIVGEGPVADRLGEALESSLSQPWESVERVDSVANVSGDGPVLVVGVTSTDISYNPITPSARVRADFGFVGAGNATLAKQFALGERPVVLTNETPYVVQGQVTIEDRSRGLVSIPGYHAHVTDRLATKLGSSISSAPGMQSTG